MKSKKQEAYVLNIKESLFYLCPKGAGHGSIRLYEVMELGVAPVVLSDGWIPPEGPNWEDFIIFIKERDISKIEKILEGYRDKAPIMGHKAREACDTYFAKDKHALEIHRMIQGLLDNRNSVRENIIYTFFSLFNAYTQKQTFLKDKLKKLVRKF